MWPNKIAGANCWHFRNKEVLYGRESRRLEASATIFNGCLAAASMVKFTTIAKNVGQVFFMVLMLLFLSLIPLLMAGNLLVLFRWLDDRGWSHLALLSKVVAVVLAGGTIVLLACVLAVVFVLTARDIIRDLKSKDESHAG